MDRKKYFKQFNQVLRIKGLQPTTASNYNSHLNNFLNWCEQINKPPEECENNNLIEYLSLEPSYYTVKQRRGMLTNLYEFVLHQGYKLYGLPFPKQPKHIPDYFTPEELYRIFSLVKNQKQICVLKTQYALGLRVSEVVSIKRKDFIKKFNPELNKFQWDIKVRGKGSKDRILPVPDETMEMIKAYWRALPISEQHPIFLFKGQFCSHYSVKSVQLIIKRAMNLLGIEKQGSSHLIRKSRASHFGQNGVDAKYIKDFLGHEGFKYVDCYVKLNTEHLRKSFEQADVKILPLLNPQLQLTCNR